MNLFAQTIKALSISALGCVAVLTNTHDAQAQISYPYVADFETGTTTPANQAYASTDPINMNGMDWTLPGVFLGTMLDNDKFNGERSGRMRLTTNATGDPGSMYSNSDFPAGVGNVTVSLANYGSESGSTITVQYSLDAGTTWVDAETITPTETLTAYTVPVNQPGNVRIKFLKDAAAGRVNIDDINITMFEDASSITPISRAPIGTGVPVSTEVMTIQYNHPVQNGSGTITVTNTMTSAEQVFSVPSSSVTIDEDIVTITGLSLENATSYYVTMEAGVFAKADDADIINDAITGTADWTFSTSDETPFSTLNETFNDCINPDLTANFFQYSVTGDKTWRCSTRGRDDDAAVYINGGSSEGVSETNEDWLISSRPFTPGTASAPKVLSFYSKRYYSGTFSLKVKVSTDYAGSGDPSSATWTDIHELTETSEDWNLTSDIALPTSGNFHMAFVYSCNESGAPEITLDDVKVEIKTTSIEQHIQNNQSLKVLGDATTESINLFLNTAYSGDYTFYITDMSGRVISTKEAYVGTGDNHITLAPLNLATGLYIIRVQNNHSAEYIAPVKAAVR